MTKADELRGENQALRERLSRLGEASLRISESLDLNTVLREVVESARDLTGAGCSGIATMDGSGQLQDFVTSGLSPEEHQRFLDLPHGPGLWEYLRQVPQPLRLKDLAAHLRSLGFPDDPTLARSFLGAPIRHQGVQVGNFYLADKEAEQEFTSEDEEVLALFASQAGAAIANARKHREEQRARADLEALIDTSPVGVVVFDARSGQVASLNQESRRIVGDLCRPGRSAEELLEVLRVRRADGQEIDLEKSPLAQALGEATTIRAEEIILEVPDGRKVRTLINATPIRSDQDEVESVVVTLQDMTPLEELERLRAEFLGMVSHELRAPLTSIKGCAATVLGASSALDPAETLQFFRIIDEQADHLRDLIGDLLDAARIETGTLSVAPEPADLAVIVDQARNTFLSGGGRNPVRIDLPPDLPRVRADRQRIVQVLVNLLTNAARHSPESSPSGWLRCGRAFRWRSRSLTKVEASRPSVCRTCSGSLPVAARRTAELGPVWAWPSARAWWRRTGAASGPRAQARVWARGSLSPFRWSRRSQVMSRRVRSRHEVDRGAPGGRSHTCWWWTTTRRHWDTCGAFSRTRATARS